MTVINSDDAVEAQSLGGGVSVKQLITLERVHSDRVRTDKLWLEAGAETDFSVDTGDLAWAHLLGGSATRVTGDGERHRSTQLI